MQYFFYILAIPFLFLNYKIIRSDISNKIIPNRFLFYILLLVPLHFLYTFFALPDIHILSFILQIFFAFLISFILYYFGLWSAGDAKYLLILSLFIPHIGVIPFIGNIALLTLLYLFVYFIYFYLYKSIFIRSYRKSLWGDVRNDLKDKFKTFLKAPDGEIVKKTAILKLLKWGVIFLMLFVSIRLSRIYLLSSALSGETSRYTIVQKILEEYHIYVIFIFLLGFIGCIYLIRIGINKFKGMMMSRYEHYIVSSERLSIILLSVLFTCLMGFIIFELFTDFYVITDALYKIFTLYIILYLIAMILIYSYKITFGIAEQDHINIKDLKKGEIVDKPFLIKMFGKQIALGHVDEENGNTNKRGLLYPDPLEYFKNLDNPVDEENTKILKKVYAAVNMYHIKKETPHFSEIDNIKILKTFSFGGYIFCGFIITYFLGSTIFRGILDYIIEVMKSFYV